MTSRIQEAAHAASLQLRYAQSDLMLAYRFGLEHDARRAIEHINAAAAALEAVLPAETEEAA